MAQGAQLLQLPGAATRAQPARSEWYQLSGEPEKHNMAQRSAALRGTLNEANSAHTPLSTADASNVSGGLHSF